MSAEETHGPVDMRDIRELRKDILRASDEVRAETQAGFERIAQSVLVLQRMNAATLSALEHEVAASRAEAASSLADARAEAASARVLSEVRAKAEALEKAELRSAIAGLVVAHGELQGAIHGFIERTDAARTATIPGPMGFASLLSPADIAALRWSGRAIARLSRAFGTTFETTRLVLAAMLVGVIVATTLTACVMHVPGIL